MSGIGWVGKEGVGDDGRAAVAGTDRNFWVERDAVVSDTPILSVNPAAAWAGGNNTVVSSTAGSGPRAITARDTVASITNANFDHWFPLGAGNATDAVLTVAQGGSTWALALYQHHDGGGFRRPDKTTKPGPIQIPNPGPLDRSRMIDVLKKAMKDAFSSTTSAPTTSFSIPGSTSSIPGCWKRSPAGTSTTATR